MTQADQIRQFAFDHYVAPARAARRIEVVIRAGDVHSEMHLTNAMPAVCSALGGRKFEAFAGATIVERTGPTMGANVRFRISLTDSFSTGHVQAPSQKRTFASDSVPTDLDLANSMVLVSCVKSKLTHPAQARSLYISAWFQKARAIVEASGARWFVLSSLYGLVAPETEIAPYDWTSQYSGGRRETEVGGQGARQALVGTSWRAAGGDDCRGSLSRVPDRTSPAPRHCGRGAVGGP